MPQPRPDPYTGERADDDTAAGPTPFADFIRALACWAVRNDLLERGLLAPDPSCRRKPVIGRRTIDLDASEYTSEVRGFARERDSN